MKLECYLRMTDRYKYHTKSKGLPWRYLTDMLPKIRLALCFLIALAGCKKDEPPEPAPVENLPIGKSISYLALGDSYTIGTAIGLEKAYPAQLRDSLLLRPQIDSVKIDVIARGGWTTGNLINGMIDARPDSSYQLVSLLIGVNNQYQRRSLGEYRTQFRLLLQWSLALAANDTGRVFVLSIPDYGVTPAGQGNATTIAMEIDQFNAVNREITDSLGVAYYNITDISRLAASDPALIANDGLHFSSAMHTLWVRFIHDEVYSLL